MPRVAVLIASVLACASLVATPRIAVAQPPPSDVTVGDARSNGGLSLTVFSAAFLSSETATSVLIGVEVRGLAGAALPQTDPPRQLELNYLAESGGATRARHSVVLPLADGDTVRRAAEQGARILTRIPLSAGRYALRVTARDSGDRRTATVVRDLEVPNLLEASITMSDLVMSASGVSGVTYPQPQDDTLLPVVGQPPTGRRQFSRGETVEVNAEVYEAPTCDGFGANLNLITSIVTPDGRVVFESTDIGSSETLPNGVFGYRHYALVPIATLIPGPYVVRVSVLVDGSMPAWRAVPIMVIGEKVRTEN